MMVESFDSFNSTGWGMCREQWG